MNDLTPMFQNRSAQSVGKGEKCFTMQIGNIAAIARFFGIGRSKIVEGPEPLTYFIGIPR
jgi:hypothetical protein